MTLLEEVDNNITEWSREGKSKQELMEYLIPYVLAFPNDYELSSRDITGQELYEVVEDAVVGLMWKDDEPESNEDTLDEDDDWDDPAEDVPF